MTRGASLITSILAALILAAPAEIRAQEVRGVAVGPQGEPLADVVVALHRIGDMGAGANVASTTTDQDGRFQFDVTAADSALYFAAMRYDERLYIGPPAMAGIERVTGYVLAADPAAEAGAVASALARPPGAMAGGAAQAPRTGATGQGGSGAALWLAALLALTAAAVFIITAPRYRRRRTREALVEIATLENELASGVETGERSEIVRRRDQLRERLAPPS
jgi:hypothetical protein